MKFHKKLVAGLMLAANLVISAHASSGGIPWDKANGSDRKSVV